MTDLFVEVNALPRFDAAGELIEVVVTFIDVTEREARHRHTELLNSQLAEIAITDDLTQLSNRRGIIETARSALAWARRHSQPLSVLMIDLDHFKQVNNRFGHAGGDAMLLAMAIRITESLRSQDSVGRFGGEEFLAVLPAPMPPLPARSRNVSGRRSSAPAGKPMSPRAWVWSLSMPASRWIPPSCAQTRRCTAPRLLAATWCAWRPDVGRARLIG